MKNQILNEYSELPFIFGGASLSGDSGGYGFGQISSKDSQQLLEFCYESSLRVFDTAPIYGFGESEETIGSFVKGKREDCFLISKGGVSWHNSKRVNMTNEPKVIETMIHESLTRLNTDYIDLYMIHWPDERVDIRRALEVLVKAKEKEKIKHIGLCNTNLDDINKANELERIQFIQSELNYFNQAPYNDTKDYLQNEDVTFMSWGTLDKGILTKRAHKQRKYDSSDARSWAPWWKKMDKNSKYERVEKLEKSLLNYGVSLLEFALHYNLSFEYLDYVLVGAKKPQQLYEIVKALKKEIPKELKEIMYEL
ncbi:MAG: aldo/keto reductase [Bacteriovoracaceae bacterium]